MKFASLERSRSRRGEAGELSEKDKGSRMETSPALAVVPPVAVAPSPPAPPKAAAAPAAVTIPASHVSYKATVAAASPGPAAEVAPAGARVGDDAVLVLVAPAGARAPVPTPALESGVTVSYSAGAAAVTAEGAGDGSVYCDVHKGPEVWGVPVKPISELLTSFDAPVFRNYVRPPTLPAMSVRRPRRGAIGRWSVCARARLWILSLCYCMLVPCRPWLCTWWCV